jgi:hypothetical protein
MTGKEGTTKYAKGAKREKRDKNPLLRGVRLAEGMIAV